VRQDPRLGGLATEVRTEGANDAGLDEDRLGNCWRTSKPDERVFHYARNGDHLMVAFECDFCVFRKIRPGERPNLIHGCDTLLLACIRRVNLDSFLSRAT
jgi:predicted nuclease of predicted toxin-antitoxin system